MDWAEELKMSIRKKTARKGRRSKSRDALDQKEGQSPSVSTTNDAVEKSDLLARKVNANPASAGVFARDPATPFPKTSGGWANSALRSFKVKREPILEAATIHSATNSIRIQADEIPAVPDYEETGDQTSLQVARRLSPHSGDSKKTFSRKVFPNLCDEDLSILSRGLKSQESLQELEVWCWGNLFAAVVASINVDKISSTNQDVGMGSDEFPPSS